MIRVVYRDEFLNVILKLKILKEFGNTLNKKGKSVFKYGFQFDCTKFVEFIYSYVQTTNHCEAL